MDGSSRVPSPKRRANQAENQDEPYIDVKVFIVVLKKKIRMRKKKKHYLFFFSLESINVRCSSSHSIRRSNVYITKYDNRGLERYCYNLSRILSL